jgi:hypothetical protein
MSPAYTQHVSHVCHPFGGSSKRLQVIGTKRWPDRGSCVISDSVQDNMTQTLEVVFKTERSIVVIMSQINWCEGNGLGCHPNTVPFQRRVSRHMKFREYTWHTKHRIIHCKIVLSVSSTCHLVGFDFGFGSHFKYQIDWHQCRKAREVGIYIKWEDCIVSHICRSCFHIRQEVSLWHQVCQVTCSKVCQTNTGMGRRENQEHSDYTRWKTVGKQHDDLKKNTMDKTLEITLKVGMNPKLPTWQRSLHRWWRHIQETEVVYGG